MKTFLYLALVAVAALSFAACGNMPANNANAGNATNSNANANKAVAAAPTKEALLELEKKAFEAWQKKDGTYFEAFLADNYTSNMDGKTSTKPEEIKSITESKCEVKSFDLTEPQITPISPDAAVLTTKATVDATCEGKAIPSPIVSATLFVRSGDTWKAAYHNEVPVAEAQAKVDDAKANVNAKVADAKTKVEDAKANKAAANTTAAATPKPAATATPASNTTAAANTTSNSNANSTSSTDVTAAVLAVEKAGWDAWKLRDVDKAKVLVMDNATFVSASGQIANGNDAIMKAWFGPKCDVKTVNVSDPKAVSILGNVALLTFKGGATGQCDGNPIKTLWGSSIYVKDGDAWKLAYGFEVPEAKS
jgi:ketosteroid isomerase-like protein